MRPSLKSAGPIPALLLALGALAAPAEAQSWGQYGFDVLPMPTGYSIEVNASSSVNDAGQVVVYQSTGRRTTASFIWDADSGSFTNVGSLGTGQTRAFAINDAGQVAGYSTNAVGVSEAFFYDGTSMTGLGTPGGSTSFATDINDAGQLVGTSRSLSHFRDAFVSDGTSIPIQGLGTLGGSTSYGQGINNAGQVAGLSRNAAGRDEAFLYDGTSMHGLGTLGGLDSYGRDINGAGHVVGSSDNGTSEEAFLYNGTSMQGLGTLGGAYSRALGISDAGQVVGEAGGGTIGNPTAVLWEGGTGYFLDALVGGGWTFRTAKGISDGGTIVALGFNASVNGGALTNVVLRQTSVAVPEPSSLLLLLSGMLGLGLVARRRGGLAEG